ncbi:hypothetical protein ACP4OV_018121 [Aristida adscensionis]
MEEAMLKFYPDGIRVLLVDGDPKFMKSASTLLTLLNFKETTMHLNLFLQVATTDSPISAMHPAYYQQQQSTAGNVIMPPTATRTGMVNAAPPAATMTAKPIAVTHQQLRLSLDRQKMTFGPFPYQGPVPSPATHQARWAPPVTGSIGQPPFQQPAAGGGGLYMGMPSGPIAGETAAASMSRAGAFGSSTAVHLMPTPSLNHSSVQDSYDLAAMAATYTIPQAALDRSPQLRFLSCLLT